MSTRSTWSYDHITVFLTNGQTLRFHKVTGYGGIYAPEIAGIYANFEYESASDGKRNIATLYLDQIVMVSGANPVEVKFETD